MTKATRIPVLLLMVALGAGPSAEASLLDVLRGCVGRRRQTPQVTILESSPEIALTAIRDALLRYPPHQFEQLSPHLKSGLIPGTDYQALYFTDGVGLSPLAILKLKANGLFGPNAYFDISLPNQRGYLELFTRQNGPRPSGFTNHAFLKEGEGWTQWFEIDGFPGVQTRRVPRFPTVYPPGSPYSQALLQAALPRMQTKGKVLVMGSGSGVDAAVIATTLGYEVDAVDFNPIAVENTRYTAATLGLESLVRSWRSDVFSEVSGRYDYILFNAPATVDGKSTHTDPNRFDRGGQLQARFLGGLKAHLTPNGRAFLMSLPRLPRAHTEGLISNKIHEFTYYVTMGIHEIQGEVEP